MIVHFFGDKTITGFSIEEINAKLLELGEPPLDEVVTANKNVEDLDYHIG